MNKNNGINIREEVDKLFDSPPPSWPTDSTPYQEYLPAPEIESAGPILWLKDHIHEWFELSYAQYLTIPRSVLQSMPEEWQERFVKCLEELDEAIDWRPEKGRYWVQLRDENGRFVPDPLSDYQRGRRRLPLNTEK